MKINLITEKNNNDIKLKQIAISILLFIVILFVSFNIFLKINHYYSLKKEYDELKQSPILAKNYKEKYYTIKSNFKKNEFNRFNWGKFFQEIYLIIPENIIVNKIKLESYVVLIEGRTKEKNLVFNLINKLKKLNFCKEISVENLESKEDILFSIKFLLERSS